MKLNSSSTQTKKRQPWEILYACDDDELLYVRVDKEENKRKFNLDLNKIITCIITFGVKFLEKFNNKFTDVFILSFIYSITSPN